MATIIEDYVSFETAKLLKEKGFDQNCATYYLDGQVWRHYHGEVIPKYKQIYAAPTQATAMKWLREVHKLSIEPYYDIVLSWVVDIKYIGKYTNHKEFEEVRSQTYNSYEQVCEEAIRYCLKNLI